MKKIIPLSITLLIFLSIGFSQNDTIAVKTDDKNIFASKKFITTIGLESRIMIKQKDSAFLVPGWILEAPLPSSISLNNSITPFLNFNVSKYYKHWLFGIGTRVGAIIYSDKMPAYLERKMVKAGQYVLNIVPGVGYLFKVNNWFICPKVNLEYKFLYWWMNEDAGGIYYYEGFYTTGTGIKSLLYLHGELSVFIPVHRMLRIKNKHFIIPKVECFIHSFENNIRFFNNYTGGNYYYLYTGLSWAF